MKAKMKNWMSVQWNESKKESVQNRKQNEKWMNVRKKEDESKNEKN